MPETIIPCSRNGALSDAIARVTRSGRYPWQFVEWTTNRHQQWFNGLESINIYTGMRGRIRRPHGWVNFTIRHDFDFADGMVQNGGKGYHVNVELPNEKIAYTASYGERYALDCWDFLSQRITYDGNLAAAGWFMGFMRT